MNLPHRLDREVSIRAPRDLVFRFFSSSDYWSKWWGAGSTIDPRPGGRAYIRYANGTEAGGEVLEVKSPERIVFTFGYASGKPMPLGASRVTISLTEKRDETHVRLTHELSDAKLRDEHVQGWRYQLSTFANVVTNELHANAAAAIDEWFSAWNEPDDSRRLATLSRVAVTECQYRDRFSSLTGADEISLHAGAAQKFMPGFRISRSGNVRHCQGVILADWIAEGSQAAKGTTMFVLSPSGRIEWATGFWSS